jgi:hypothetical protein
MNRNQQISKVSKPLFTWSLALSSIVLISLFGIDSTVSAREQIISLGNTSDGDPVYIDLESPQGHSGLYQVLVETRLGRVASFWYEVSCSERRIFEMDVVLNDEGRVQSKKYVQEVSSAPAKSLVQESMGVICQQRGARGW